MSSPYPIRAALFDMDGLLIDSEPLWDQAEIEVIESLGVDVSRRNELPDMLGLRIDLVVDLWYNQQPWQGVTRAEATSRIIERTMTLVAEQRPLLPGVKHAVELCQSLDLKIGLASASPLRMLEMVLEIFNLRDAFSVLSSAESLPFSKPHPQVYLNAASQLGISPLSCTTLEDSVNGMIATRAARMRSLVVPAAENQADPRWVLAHQKLESLEQLNATHLLG
ncbi:2-deoxyglucose-6-phosphatase [Salmonella enterica subsp. enterica serovar Choleraesuis]|nr:2-deoxyglucose-6-phosphatase [Salmonella enterica subsp. enterica serovar Choleraesuis]